MEETPKMSFRQLHQQLNLSVGATHKLLRKDLKVCPYDMDHSSARTPISGLPTKIRILQLVWRI